MRTRSIDKETLHVYVDKCKETSPDNQLQKSLVSMHKIATLH